ncbi:MAG TPA: GNAT family N-acetyltransferase [Puia sp.]|nr:GNAT family N-acetyltransferase [Puia sp.]
MIVITPIRTEDLEAIREFQPEGWGDIVELFIYNIQCSFCYPIKMSIEGRMVAVGNTVLYKDTAWLSQIIVHPEHRNRGLGKAMTQELIDQIDHQQYKTILLDATSLGYPVYQKLGFETISEHLHFSAHETESAFEKSGSIISTYDRDHENIFQLDKLATGEQREKKLMENLHEAWIYSSNRQLQGIYFPTLGKGLIIAQQPDAGIELMKCRMNTNKSSMLPAENKPAIDFLLSNGWTQIRMSRRMKLGRMIAWKPGYIYNVISGAFG